MLAIIVAPETDCTKSDFVNGLLKRRCAGSTFRKDLPLPLTAGRPHGAAHFLSRPQNLGIFVKTRGLPELSASANSAIIHTAIVNALLAHGEGDELYTPRPR
ncbi:MAG: hypothetical protein O3A21_04050, partial [Proteobacteria bacterium]|nr:hypothetical protein [Pseudomonadota bacterium]